MRRIILSILFLYFGFAYCQDNPKIDSLKRVLSNTTDEKERAKTMVMLGKAYYQLDFASAMSFIDQSIVISRKNQFDKIMADAFNVKGILYIDMGQYQDAILYFDSTAMLFKKNGNKVGMATVFGNLGGLYFAMGDYSKSMENHLKCLAINDSLNNKLGAAIALEGVASIYFVQKYFEKSILWYSKALIIHREIGDKGGEIPDYINIALSLSELGKYPEAISSFEKAIKISDSLNNKETLAEAYFGLGELYHAKGENDKSLNYLFLSLEIFESVGNIYRSIEVDGYLADIYFDKKEYAKSITYDEKFLFNARAIKAKQYIRDAYKGLYQGYTAMRQYEKACEYQSKYIALNDSILNEEKIKQLTEMQTRFETEKKESENKLLQQENQIQSYKLSRGVFMIIGLGILLLIAIGLAILLVRHNKLKSEQRNIQLEQKLLRSQMNPHFIFNSLTAIQSFIYNNDPKEAGRYLSGFAKLIRLILENSREEFISLSKEISTLEHYLELQKLRFEDRFRYSIHIQDGLDTENIAIPPMLAQPFIENSIEHGIKEIEKEGVIEIRFSLKNNNILFAVDDNGPGFEQSLSDKKNKSTHKPMAMIITNERLSIINRNKRAKVKLLIERLKDPLNDCTGTHISFTIPFREIYGK
jgi:tetratricopeptide (TPR) repeat protein